MSMATRLAQPVQQQQLPAPTLGAALGAQAWALADGATLQDVTHLGCRAARFTPKGAGAICTPEAAPAGRFPLQPGDVMPGVQGCAQQDYAVLFIVGLVGG